MSLNKIPKRNISFPSIAFFVVLFLIRKKLEMVLQ